MGNVFHILPPIWTITITKHLAFCHPSHRVIFLWSVISRLISSIVMVESVSIFMHGYFGDIQQLINCSMTVMFGIQTCVWKYLCESFTRVCLQVDQTKEVVKEGTDAVSNLPYFETSIPVYRKDVEMYNGLDGYKCQCYASSGKGEQAVRSDSALVKVARKSTSIFHPLDGFKSCCQLSDRFLLSRRLPFFFCPMRFCLSVGAGIYLRNLG